MSDKPVDLGARKVSGTIAVLTGLLIALAANAAEIGIWLDLFSIPRGTSIRPMGAAAMAFMIAGWAAFLGVPISIAGMILARRIWRWLGALAIVLCLTPLPLGRWFFHFVVDMRGLYLSD